MSRKMRIGAFTYTLPQVGRSFGGVGTVAHQLANGLAARGHEVTVWSYSKVTPPNAAYRCRLAPADFVHGTHLGKRLLQGYFGNLLPLGIPRRDLDVFLFHGDSLFGWWLDVPIIRVFHGSALDESRNATSVLRRFSQRGIYYLETLSAFTNPHCVAVSQNTRDSFPSIQTVIPNGIDLKLFSPAPEKMSPHPSLMFIGSAKGRKRGLFALDLFRELKREIPELTLDFVGELPSSLAPKGVRVHTAIEEAALVELYRRAWLLFSPSLYEGFGMPYLEAMATGTPVLATPNVGSRELTADGRFGVLAEDEQLAATALRLLRSTKEREEWAKKGRERAKEYDLEKTIDQYEDLIARVCPPANLSS